MRTIQYENSALRKQNTRASAGPSAAPHHIVDAIRKQIQAIGVIAAVLLTCSCSKEPGVAPARNEEHESIVARTLLEEGQASGSLPEGVVVRVSASLFGPGSKNKKARASAEAQGVVAEEPLTETWELTSNQVHRVVVETRTNPSIYRRVESRPFDSQSLCKELLEGKALEIQAGRGHGKPLQFVGTNYKLGHRYIEILRNGETVLRIGESCYFPGYAESDARAFAALYERLASQARALFKSKTDEAK